MSDTLSAPETQALNPGDGESSAAAESESAKNGKGFRREVFPAGTRVFHEGDPAECAYIVEAGSIELTKESGDGRETVVAVLGKGEILGEMALVDGGERSVTARAVETTICAVVPKDSFLRQLEQMPPFSRKLLQVMTKRLRAQTRQAALFRHGLH